MKKYRIAYITDTGKIGGAEKVLFFLLKNINRDIFEPFVILGSEGPLVEKIRSLGIGYTIIEMPEMKRIEMNLGQHRLYNPSALLINFFHLVKVIFKLVSYFKKHSFDVIHTNNLQSKLCGSVAAKVTGNKMVWHLHNIQPPGLRRKIISLMANVFPNKIIVVSEAVQAVYLPYTRDTKKIVVIHNGFDVSDLMDLDSRLDIRKEFNIPPVTSLVGIIAFLRPWKGQDNFLRAAAEVKKKYSGIKFLIVGDEQFGKDKGYKEYLINLSKELDIFQDTIFTGFRNDVATILSRLDILVSASVLPDPFPTIILEAMASQKPIVATNIGGIPEMVKDGETGLLVPPDQPIAMAKAILKLLCNKGKANEMGLAARQRLENLFSMDKFIANIQKVYWAILE